MRWLRPEFAERTVQVAGVWGLGFRVKGSASPASKGVKGSMSVCQHDP